MLKPSLNSANISPLTLSKKTIVSTTENHWQGRTDGTNWMHNALTVFMRFVPLRFMYLIADIFVVPFYLLFSNSYLAIYHYFRKIHNYNPIKSFFSTYKNYCQFSKNILDKFYMFSGGKFDFEIENMDLYESFSKKNDGFLIFSAHVGNYELAGYTLRATDKPFNALVFAAEADIIMKNRTKLFAGNNIKMIPVTEDMSHLFTLNNALEKGESVSIPADRVVGEQKTFATTFLGREALFPAGPFLLAAKRDLDVLSIQVMKVATKKYHIYIKALDKYGASVQERSMNLLHSYITHIETVLRTYPHQWFNFYEFWKS